jgi:hypothetical protein
MGEAAQLKRVIVTGPVAGVRVAVTGVIEMSGFGVRTQTTN